LGELIRGAYESIKAFFQATVPDQEAIPGSSPGQALRASLFQEKMVYREEKG
jgi:hypothetical protein